MYFARFKECPEMLQNITEPKVSESRSVVSNSLRPHGLYSPRNSPDQNTGVRYPFPSPGDCPNPGIKPRSSALQVDSLPTEPQGKSEPKLT